MFFEKAFEAAARITAAAMEEAELELNAEGAEQAGDFFEALYRRLSRLEAEKEEFRSHEYHKSLEYRQNDQYKSYFNYYKGKYSLNDSEWSKSELW